MKVVYQGIEGSYHDAALREFAQLHNLEARGLPDPDYFGEVFDRVINETGYGWVAISNSQAGTVYQCMDQFRQHDVRIIGEYYFRVDHCFAIKRETELSHVQAVYSHIQALEQCSEYSRKHGLRAEMYHDTAAAAELVASSGQPLGCYCSETAAELHGLQIVSRAVQNKRENYTRFLLICNKENAERFLSRYDGRENWKTTLMFTTKDIPAALYKCLGGFATNGVNLTKLESRPTGQNLFEYFFYMDIEGKQDQDKVIRAVNELKMFARDIRSLGSYWEHLRS